MKIRQLQFIFDFLEKDLLRTKHALYLESASDFRQKMSKEGGKKMTYLNKSYCIQTLLAQKRT